MIFKDYYKILGLDSNKVSIEEIKEAYREKAKKYHPDINIGNSEAEAIFKDVNEAYKTLSDPALKRKYDFKWNKYFGSKKRAEKKEKKTFKEMFLEIFFGGVSKTKTAKIVTPEYGENIDTEIDISMKEAFFGVNKKLELRTVNGKETSFSFKVPAGIQNHDKIRIVGRGKKGKNGGKNGDLLVIVNIKDDKKYKLIGTDIYTELPITTWEAALGTRKKINLFDEEINLIIPQCCSSGEKIKIPQKGYKDGRGKRGNLYVITRIILPKNISKEEAIAYTKIKELETSKVIKNIGTKENRIK